MMCIYENIDSNSAQITIFQLRQNIEFGKQFHVKWQLLINAADRRPVAQ